MGYTTEFTGAFTLDKPLRPEHAAYLRKFNTTRRMQRADYDAAGLPDPEREAAGLPLGGPDAPYFVGGVGSFGQGSDRSVRDRNEPPEGQPGLWCQWQPTEDNNGIQWDGGEKLYHYTEWLRYIVQHFLKPWGYVLDGRVRWQGEEPDDQGTIVASNNNVTAVKGRRRVKEKG